MDPGIFAREWIRSRYDAGWPGPRISHPWALTKSILSWTRIATGFQFDSVIYYSITIAFQWRHVHFIDTTAKTKGSGLPMILYITRQRRPGDGWGRDSIKRRLIFAISEPTEEAGVSVHWRLLIFKDSSLDEISLQFNSTEKLRPSKWLGVSSPQKFSINSPGGLVVWFALRVNPKH